MIEIIGVEINYRNMPVSDSGYMTDTFMVGDNPIMNLQNEVGEVSKIEITADKKGCVVYFTNGIIIEQETGIHRIIYYDPARNERVIDPI